MRPVYVIIGGGTSGIILALQLLEFADVFLIEMGSEMHSQTCKLCQNPLLWTETANCEPKCNSEIRMDAPPTAHPETLTGLECPIPESLSR